MNKDKKNIPQDEKTEEKEELSELDALKQHCEEYKTGWMRAQADYQNLQKEIENKRGEWIKMSEAQILQDFIPIYDNFKKAFNNDTDTRIYADDTDYADMIKRFNSWKQGIGYIMKQFGDILKEYNIEEIKTVGETFNPVWHEAVGEETVEGVEAGEIVKEVDAGYKMGEKVLKAARVIVAK